MKLVSVIFLFSVLFFACHKNGGDGGTAHFGTFLHYVDSSGNDLYSLTNYGQNGYWMDSIAISNIQTGSSYVTLDCYNNHINPYQFQNLVVLEMQVCPNYNLINRYSYTIIKLEHGVIDTLKIHVIDDVISLSTNIDTIWYNNTIKYYDYSTGAITIVK